MKKRSFSFTALLLILVSIMAFTACDPPVSGLPVAATAFIEAVDGIGMVTLESKDKLDTAIGLYNVLSADEKALTEVVSAKTTYDTKKGEYDVLLDTKNTNDAAAAFKALVNAIPALSSLTTGSAHKKAITDARASYDALSSAAKSLSIAEFNKLLAAETKMKELVELDAAEAFIALANALPAQVVLTDEAQVAGAEAAYSGLSAAAKAFVNVIAAKSKVDAARARLTALGTAGTFIALVNAIPAQVTLANEAQVADAETAYVALSQSAKEVDGVSVAYTKVQQARSRLTVLTAAKAAADSFIASIDGLPLASALAESDITAINAAKAAYDALNTDAKNMPGVSAAYNILTALTDAYNELFGIKRIPMTSATISFAGDDITFNIAMITAVAEFYETNQAGLSGKTKLFLYAYFASEEISGNSLFCIELDVAAQTGTVTAAVIIQALKDSYIGSNFSNGVTPDKQYKFAFLFTDETGNAKITQSNYSAFSSAHSFTYDKPLTPDEAEAQDFLALAAAIPALASLTTGAGHKDAVAAARAEYGTLGEGAKALAEVITAYDKLVAAEVKLADLIAAETAEAFIGLVNAISDPVTMDDADEISAARAYYESSLKDNAAALAKTGVAAAYAKLIASETAVADLIIAEEITVFKGLVEAFSNPATQSEVSAARAYYDSMGHAAKADAGVIAAHIILVTAEDDLALAGITPETLRAFFGLTLNPSLVWGEGATFAQSFKAKYGNVNMTDAKLLTFVHFRVWVYNAGDLNTPLFYYNLQSGELVMLTTDRLNAIFAQNRDKLTASSDVASEYAFILQVIDARGAADPTKRVHFDSATTECGPRFTYTKVPTAAEIEAKTFLNAVAAMPAINTIVFDTLLDTQALAKIDAARTAYNGLSTDAKAVAGVASALTVMETAEAKVADLTAAKTAALGFLALMEALPASADGLTTENYAGKADAITAAENNYNTLGDMAKSYTGVADAKSLLTGLRVKYNALLAEDNPDEAANQSAAAFIGLVSLISDPVTLADKGVIEAAREYYDMYIDGQLAGSKTGVAEAYAALQQAETDLLPFLAEYIKAQAFINAVNAIEIPSDDVKGAPLLALKAAYDSALALYNADIKDDAAVNSLPNVVDAKAVLDSALARYNSSYNALPQMPVSYVGMVVDGRGYVWGAATFNGQTPSAAVSSGNIYIRVYFYNSTASNADTGYLFYINITTNLSGQTDTAMFLNALAANAQYLTARPGVEASYKVNLRGEDRTGNYKPSAWQGFQELGGVLKYTVPATKMQLFELAVENIGNVSANSATGTRIAAAKAAWTALTGSEQTDAGMISLYDEMTTKEAAYFTAYAALVNNPGTTANATAIATAFGVYGGLSADSKTKAADAYTALIVNDGRHFIILVGAVEGSRVESKLTPASLGLINAAKNYLENVLHEDAKLLIGGEVDVIAAILTLDALIEEWDNMETDDQVLDIVNTLVVFGNVVYGTYNASGYNVTLPVTVTFRAEDGFGFIAALENAVITIADNNPAAGSFSLIKDDAQAGVYTAVLTIRMPGTGSRAITAGVSVSIGGSDLTFDIPEKTVSAHLDSLLRILGDGRPWDGILIDDRGILTGAFWTHGAGNIMGWTNTNVSGTTVTMTNLRNYVRMALNIYQGSTLIGSVVLPAAAVANDSVIDPNTIKSAIRTQLGMSAGTTVSFKIFITCASAATGGARVFRDSLESNRAAYSITI